MFFVSSPFHAMPYAYWIRQRCFPTKKSSSSCPFNCIPADRGCIWVASQSRSRFCLFRLSANCAERICSWTCTEHTKSGECAEAGQRTLAHICAMHQVLWVNKMIVWNESWRARGAAAAAAEERRQKWEWTKDEKRRRKWKKAEYIGKERSKNMVDNVKRYLNDSSPRSSCAFYGHTTVYTSLRLLTVVYLAILQYTWMCITCLRQRWDFFLSPLCPSFSARLLHIHAEPLVRWLFVLFTISFIYLSFYRQQNANTEIEQRVRQKERERDKENTIFAQEL